MGSSQTEPPVLPALAGGCIQLSHQEAPQGSSRSGRREGAGLASRTAAWGVTQQLLKLAEWRPGYIHYVNVLWAGPGGEWEGVGRCQPVWQRRPTRMRQALVWEARETLCGTSWSKNLWGGLSPRAQQSPLTPVQEGPGLPVSRRPQSVKAGDRILVETRRRRCCFTSISLWMGGQNLGMGASRSCAFAPRVSWPWPRTAQPHS